MRIGCPTDSFTIPADSPESQLAGGAIQENPGKETAHSEIDHLYHLQYARRSSSATAMPIRSRRITKVNYWRPH